MAIRLVSTTAIVTDTDPITFTNIPQNAKDLMIVLSGRNNSSNTTIEINLGNNLNWTSQHLSASGPTVSAATGTDGQIANAISSSGATANIFGNTSIYISNYTSTSTGKMVLVDALVENNGSTAGARLNWMYWNNTSNVETITLSVPTGSFLTLTSVSLYTIS